MLVLPIQLGGHHYAVESRHVVEVVPRVPLRVVPHAPPLLVGLLAFRGKVVPVIDLAQLLHDTPTSPALSTRILVVRLGEGEAGRLVGLVAEAVTEAVPMTEDQFSDAGMHVPGSPHLGGVASTEHGLVPMILVQHLPQVAEVRSLLTGSDGGEHG
jgi:chemotaxis-related protein WspB